MKGCWCGALMYADVVLVADSGRAAACVGCGRGVCDKVKVEDEKF